MTRTLYLLMLLTALSCLAGPATLTESDGTLVLENDWLRAVVNPAAGGRVESFVAKASGRDLTRPLAAGQAGGLLGDGVYQQDYFAGDWLRATCSEEVLDRGPEQVRVRLSAPGTVWKGLVVTKILTLRADSMALRADYDLAATDDVDERCRPDWHFHQALAGPGTVYAPSESGVQALPRTVEDEAWVHAPAGGWLGYVGDTGIGLAAVFDAHRVKAFRVERDPAHTMEWIWRKTQAVAGESTPTTVWLAPTDGLTRIDGAGEAMAASLSLDGGRIALALCPFRAVSANCAFTVRRLATGKETPLTTISQQLIPGQRHEAAFNLPDGLGSCVVRVVISENGKPLLTLERPHFDGDGVYARTPTADRALEVEDSPTWQRYQPKSFNFSSTDIATPHRPWVSKWAAGRPRVLAIMPQHTGREAVELARRFDMDLTCAFVSDDTYYMIGDRVRSLKAQELNDALIARLAEPFDVIILSMYKAQFDAGSWNQLDGRAQRALIAKVEAGTPLVLCQAGAPDKLFPETSLVFPDPKAVDGRVTGPLAVPTDAPPTLQALPLGALPALRYVPKTTVRIVAGDEFGLAEQQPAAATLATVEGAPAVVAGKLGKGRFVHSLAGAPLIPGMRQIDLTDRAARAFDYWEYQYAAMARLIYWAAGKTAPVELLAIEPHDGQLALKFSAKAAAQGTVRLLLRNPFGELIAESTVPAFGHGFDAEEPAPLVIKAGKSTLTLPLPAGSGARFVDVIVSGPDGVLAFGAAELPPGPVRIASLTATPDFVPPDGQAALTAKLTGPLPDGALLRAELRDGSGRVVARAEAPAAPTVALQLPVAGAIGQWYAIRAAIVAGERILHQAQVEGTIAAPQHPAGYQAFFWADIVGDISEDVTNHSFGFFRDRLGMNANWLGAIALNYDIGVLRRLGMPHAIPMTGMDASRGVTKYEKVEAAPPPPDKLKTGAGTDDKLDDLLGDLAEETTASKKPSPLHAKTPDLPGIHGEASFTEKYDTCRAVAGKWHDYYGLIYSCADENDGAVKDTCFGRETLKTFRAWLRTQYPDIAALNAEWVADYKAFDEVVPLTEDEGKAHGAKAGSYAPWLDHRQFMKVAYARWAQSAVDGARSVDPGAPVGASGTREGSVYGSRDWWLLGRAYTALGAYGGLQTPEQESYNPAMVRYKWGGYSKPNPILRQGCYENLFLTLSGLGIFHDECHINPDFTLAEAGKDLRADFVELRQGIGQQLVQAQVAVDPVYVLQSPQSIAGGYIMGHEPVSRGSRYGAAALLERLGIQYRALSYEQLAKGDFAWGRPRLIILPYACALSAAEVATLRRAVEDGATLLADLQTGIMSEHGKLVSPSPLDALFGLDRSKVTLASDDGTVETGIVPAGAQPAATGYRHTVGKGQAFYLGRDFFGEYQAGSRGDDAAASIASAQTAMAPVLEAAGVVPQATVRLADGPLSPWAELRFKHDGDTRFILVRNTHVATSPDEADLPATLHLRDGGHLYDMVAGQYLGHGDALPITLTNGLCRVIAVTPERVGEWSGQPPAAATPGRPWRATFTLPHGEGAVRLDVVHPDGSVALPYCRNLSLTANAVELAIPFALNDPAGAWHVHLTHVPTGITTTFNLTLSQ